MQQVEVRVDTDNREQPQVIIRRRLRDRYGQKFEVNRKARHIRRYLLNQINIPTIAK